MCGICGFVGSGMDAEQTVRVMTERLRHRGPDGDGFARLPGVQLGHRRLAVIDLSESGAQPMWDVDELVCIVFNGEIYNFRELRRECIARGAHFRGTSDTEVVICLYLLEGERAFSRLDGMFAFCLADTRTGVTYLVRDPMGVKPLYYQDGKEGVFFASELGALLEAGVTTGEVDDGALRAYLQLDYVPSPLCLIRGARKLNAGEMLKIEAGGPGTSQSYLNRDDGFEAQIDENEAIDEFDRLISASVRRQLVADVPLGVFLSGGVDSSIVAAVASDEANGPLHTFSIGFEEREFDESSFFDEVAERIGSVHHRRIVRARDVLALFPRLADMTGEPIADGSIFPTYLLCRFARESVTVALSGDGADELFGGYPTYGMRRTAALLSSAPAAVRAMMRFAVDRLPVDYGNLTFGYKARKFVAGLDSDPIARHHRWLGTFAPETLASLLAASGNEEDRELSGLLHSAAESVADRAVLEQLMRTDQRFYLQDQLLVKTDRASMATSLEVRPPFLSAPVVRFAHSLPPRLKVRGRFSKYLLRRWLSRRMSARVARRPKKGFGAPLGAWFRGDLKELVGDMLAESVIRRQGLLQPDQVGRLVQEHWKGVADRRKEIFNLLALSMWLEYLRNLSGSIGQAKT